MQKVSLSAIVALMLVSGASASVLVYDGFDYPTSAALSGQTNPGNGLVWSRAGAATTDTIKIPSTPGSLATPQFLPAATGNSLGISGRGDTGSNGAGDRLGLGGTINTAGTTVYYSFALRVDSLGIATNTIGAFLAGFNNSVGVQAGNAGTVGARLYGRVDPVDPTAYDLGIATNKAVAVATPPVWSSALPVGSTIFVVCSYEIVSGAGNDISRLWVNPAFTPTPPAATATDTAAGTDLGIASILLRQADSPFVTLDELRVGTSWVDVTPEPTTITLLAVGGLLLRRRRSA